MISLHSTYTRDRFVRRCGDNSQLLVGHLINLLTLMINKSQCGNKTICNQQSPERREFPIECYIGEICQEAK